jgi:hypothetical protein
LEEHIASIFSLPPAYFLLLAETISSIPIPEDDILPASILFVSTSCIIIF